MNGFGKATTVGNVVCRSFAGRKTIWESSFPYGRPVTASAISPITMLSVFEYS